MITGILIGIAVVLILVGLFWWKIRQSF